ncbi:LysR substrate-binding domain-containing protein [Sphingomonas sp. dw_22]|uniref:LysR substrate-binding domain-containing protein n=1 Tax=Sphingomonas sp. dw_22 TaxID=2721175 RepID=UPI002116FF61|nr:LysR substrate-binding domain-containing protein [Sphingomonas sp. dw_22]
MIIVITNHDKRYVMIHPDLLRSFVAVAESGTFTGAARALGLRQSTVSQQIKRLEDAFGRRLFDRDTHRVTITTEGEATLDHARRVLDALERMARYLSGTSLRGRLRIGASEDFVLSALPDVLAEFVRRYPEVNIELTAGLSENLYERFDAGALDILFVKRRIGDRRGIVAWSEPIVWVGRVDYRPPADDVLPLLLYPTPSVTRARALEALEAVGTPWRVAFTSASLTGLTAAARAGIGVMPHSARLMPAGLAVVPANARLPQLPILEFVIIGPGGRHAVADALTTAILQWTVSGHTSRA